MHFIARDYNMKRAEQMLRENRRWRRQNKVDSILESGLDTFIKLNYPLHLGISDKRSRPGLIIMIKILTTFLKEKKKLLILSTSSYCLFNIELCICSSTVLMLPLGRWNLRDGVSNGLSQRFTTYVIQCVEAVMKTVENRDAVRKPCAMPISQFSVVVDFEGFQCSQLLDIKGITLLVVPIPILLAMCI